jgi:hypothetical protein
LTENNNMVEVYKATNEMEAQVIRGLLESYGIPSLLKSHAAPSVHLFTIDGMGEVKVMVMKSMASRAKELIMSDKNA